MLTRFTILCVTGELWCYMHGAYEFMPYIVGAAILTTIADTLIERDWK
jgi:hypothetical protein